MSKNQWLLESRLSSPSTQANARRCWSGKSVRFHDLRHTFSTLAIQSGIDARTAAGMLGHYSAAFTLDTYTHVTEQMKQGAAEKIGIFMNANVNVQINVVHSASASAHDVSGSVPSNCLTPLNSTDLDPTSQQILNKKKGL